MITLLVGWVATGPVLAWVYPEHREISILAVQNLDPPRRAVFDSLWREARGTHEHRLCEQGADVTQGLKPACIDWAALAAIAGDHSCSSREMSGIVLESDWILAVADLGAKLKVDLSRIEVLSPASQLPGDQSPMLIFAAGSRAKARGPRASTRCVPPISGYNAPIVTMQPGHSTTMPTFCSPVHALIFRRRNISS